MKFLATKKRNGGNVDFSLDIFEVGHQVEYGLTELAGSLLLYLLGLLHFQLALLFLQVLLSQQSLEVSCQVTTGTPVKLLSLNLLLFVILIQDFGHGFFLRDFQNRVQRTFSESPGGSYNRGGPFERFHGFHGTTKSSFTNSRFHSLFILWGCFCYRIMVLLSIVSIAVTTW